MTFPEQADFEFFKEAKRIQGLWEPKAGDWVQDKGYVGPLSGADMRGRLVKLGKVWLPRPDQLQEMLEERGYDWRLERITQVDNLARTYCEAIVFDLREDGKLSNLLDGPTPSIALGKCLLEVLKEE